MNVLTINLLFSTLIFWIIYRIYLLPKFHKLKPKTVLVPILLLHSFRHLGLMLLDPGATYTGIPPEFAWPAALGDFLTAILALIAIPFVLKGAKGGKLIVWVFNIIGSVDLIAAITLATIFDASVYMGPAYWIPAFWVPALLVTHYITFVILGKYWNEDG